MEIVPELLASLDRIFENVPIHEVFVLDNISSEPSSFWLSFHIHLVTRATFTVLF
jgi:hypothetical protein